MNSNTPLNPQQAPGLPLHEWAAVVFIIAVLSILSFLALCSDYAHLPENSEQPHHLINSEWDVFVEGAVEKAGAHHVKRGSLISDVLALAVPAKNADLRKINLNKKVKQGQIIKIPQTIMIHVSVEGAVKSPTKISLPKGSTLAEIIPLLEFEANADIQKLQKKRLLKDSESITVKYKVDKLKRNLTKSN